MVVFPGFFSVIFKLLLIACCLGGGSRSQNVFDDTSSCRYNVNSSTILMSSPPVKFAKFGMQIAISFCGPLQSSFPGCDPRAAACVLRTKKSVLNVGKFFVLVEAKDEDDPEQTRLLLKSMHGARCAEDLAKNYTLYVTFGRNSQPSLSDYNKCEFFVQILDPRHEPPCTKRVDGGYLLDFRKLSGDTTVRSGNQTFVFNLCGVARACKNREAAACEVLADTSTYVIGTVGTRGIAYRENKRVEISYRLGMGKRRLETKIVLKCSWTVLKGNAVYVVKPTQGRKFDFIVESRLGCVKTPMSCRVRDFANYQYDLHALYKPDGFWTVSDVPNAQMRLNICGPLKSTPRICSNDYSQICHSDLRGKSLNYGSILTSLEVHDETVMATLSDGSVCLENQTRVLLTTHIGFKCASNERGPRLTGFTNCAAEILWETPKACPYYTSSGTNCYVADMIGNRDLSGIRQETDRLHKLNKRSHLRYNLCGKLVHTCKNVSDVGMCLHVDGKEHILAFANNNISSNNGILSMNYSGEECMGRGFLRTVNVSFICSYAVPTAGSVTVKIVEDQCKYDMTVMTPLACASDSAVWADSCTLIHESFVYNLAPLSRTSDNYELKGSNKNLHYSVNVCRSTLTTSVAMCLPNTGVCIYNMSEPNLKDRFYSAGAYQKLTVENNELVLRYTYGKLCEKKIDMSTLIHFKCSSEEKRLTFVKETSCVHEFTWSSPHACPRQLKSTRTISECILTDQTGSIVNLTYSMKRTFDLVVNHNVKYIFNMCDSSVTRNSIDSITVLKFERRLVRKDDGSLYVEYELNNTCSESEGEPRLVHVILTCDRKERNGNFSLKRVEGCTVIMEYKVNAVCNAEIYSMEQDENNDKNSVLYRLVNVFESALQLKHGKQVLTNESVITVVTDQSKLNKSEQRVLLPVNIFNGFINCTVTSGKITINLNTIKPVSILSPKNVKYTIGINRTSPNCMGYICKEETTVATLEQCPPTQISGDALKLNFSSSRDVAVEVWFVCNISHEFPSVLEETRKLVLSYPMEEVCALKSVRSFLSVPDAIVLGLVVFVFVALVIGAIFIKRYGCRMCYRVLFRNKSALIIPYCKNTEE